MTYTDQDIAALAEGLVGRDLPKERWTHAAHLAATLRLVRIRDAGLERDLPGIIQSYNISVGGVNDDTSGYHETITQAYLAAIRAFVAALPAGTRDSDAVAGLLATPMGDKAWPLTYWSRAPVLGRGPARLGRAGFEAAGASAHGGGGRRRITSDNGPGTKTGFRPVAGIGAKSLSLREREGPKRSLGG